MERYNDKCRRVCVSHRNRAVRIMMYHKYLKLRYYKSQKLYISVSQYKRVFNVLFNVRRCRSCGATSACRC